MATAQDYKVTFGYGAYGSAGYTQAKPHRGNDRACPIGTTVIIAGTQIGLTGATGLVTGPHLHTQAGTDLACQNTFNPTPLEFKPGTVVNTGVGNQWGNFVTVQVGSQYITYCHLSRITCSKGQVLSQPQGGNNVADKTDLGTARILAENILGRDRLSVHGGKFDDDLNKYHVNVPLTNAYIRTLWTSAEASAAVTARERYKAFYDTYNSKIAELSARPTKEELANLGAALKAEQEKVVEAEKALEEAKKTGSGISAEDSAAIKETNSIVKSILDFLKGIFK